MEQPGRGLTQKELEALLRYIKRAREKIPAIVDEMAAMVKLKRIVRGNAVMEAFDLDEPEQSRQSVPDIYGNYQPIPEDWRPSPRTQHWLEDELYRQGIHYDLNWLVEEFVAYWRARGQRLASWQQAFKHNILTKLARGMSCAPGQGPDVGPGWPRTKTNRVFDRAAELRSQRLADFDDEARDIVDAAGSGKAPDKPLGEDH